MSIDTQVAGDPTSVAAAARWVDTSLHPAVDGAADVLREADPRSGWQGRSAEAFSQWAERSAETTGKVARRTARAARELASYARALRRAQDEMEQVRAEARSAGLQVTSWVVVDPGAGPADPGRLPAAPPGLKVPLAAVAKHREALAAHEAHATLVAAYRAAERRAQEVRDELAVAVAELQEGYDALRSQGWITHGLGILSGAQVVATGVATRPGSVPDDGSDEGSDEGSDGGRSRWAGGDDGVVVGEGALRDVGVVEVAPDPAPGRAG